MKGYRCPVCGYECQEILDACPTCGCPGSEFEEVTGDEEDRQ